MLIILTTHPIQYQVPLWQALADEDRVPFEVWYLTDHAVKPTMDREFGKAFAWDLGRGTLEGYVYRFLKVNKDWTLHPTVFRGLRLEEDLRPLFKRAGATVLWVQGWQKLAYWQAVAQAKESGMKVWLRGESNDLAPTPWLKWQIKRFWLGFLFRKVDRFLCIGSANRRLYRKLGVRDDKLGSAPYFVDNERFAHQAEALRPSRMEIRSEWGIPEKAFCVLFCGKFITKKRPMDLVRAVNQLNHTGGLSGDRPVHILFVGSGELGTELRKNVHVVYDADASITSSPVDRRQPSSATFAGFLNQTEISRAYVAADCLALPSDHGETWGLVVNEALASGLPCVASDACGSAEDLVEPLSGKAVFRLGHITELAQSIAGIGEGIKQIDISRLIKTYQIDTTISSIEVEYRDIKNFIQ
jgi:glycosyltransferase involved in cell wall biosynthesis